MNYFSRKDENKAHAQALVAYAKKFEKEIQELAKNTKYYPSYSGMGDTLPLFDETEKYETKIEVYHGTTVQAVFNNETGGNRVCTLNFASYKNPGGMFLDGSMAQEESLCHASMLYPVLATPYIQDMFYKKHQKMLNQALYHSDLLYSPDIPFMLDQSKWIKADVITCAAPNKKAAQKYQGVSAQKAKEAMTDRINHVLYAVWNEQRTGRTIDTLVLGAFGCGVFGNDLKEVSEIFRNFLTGKYKNCFKKVVFAVMDEPSYDTMRTILK